MIQKGNFLTGPDWKNTTFVKEKDEIVKFLFKERQKDSNCLLSHCQNQIGPHVLLNYGFNVEKKLFYQWSHEYSSRSSAKGTRRNFNNSTTKQKSNVSSQETVQMGNYRSPPVTYTLRQRTHWNYWKYFDSIKPSANASVRWISRSTYRLSKRSESYQGVLSYGVVA